MDASSVASPGAAPAIWPPGALACTRSGRCGAVRAALPFYLPLLTVLVAIILIPAATLWLPSIMLAR